MSSAGRKNYKLLSVHSVAGRHGSPRRTRRIGPMHASRRLQAITAATFAVVVAMAPWVGTTSYAASPGAGSGTEADPFVIRAFDLGFDPTSIEVAAAGSVTL